VPHRQINLESLPSFEIEVHAEGDQYIAAEIIANGVWEPFETEVIRRCLTDESEFFDIGANIGWYSVVAGLQLAGTGGAVHAFEPARENVLLLTRNVMSAGLSNVRINPCALGVAVEPITLHLSSTNKGDHRAYACEVGRSTEKSCMSRFDQYYTSTWRRPFVKIDTQGFELSVIEGMGDLLSSAEGMAMLIEFWPHGLNQEVDNVSRLISLLSNSRFQPYTVIEGDPFVRKTTWDRLTSAARTTLAPKTGCFVNLLVAREGDPMLARLSDLLHNDASPWVPEG
jgi:FkbM family methyltransferase